MMMLGFALHIFLWAPAGRQPLVAALAGLAFLCAAVGTLLGRNVDEIVLIAALMTLVFFMFALKG